MGKIKAKKWGIVSLAAAGAALTATITFSPDPKPQMGMNTNFVREYVSALPFADVAKQGGNWFKADERGKISSPKTLATVTNQGYPTERAVMRVLTGEYEWPAGWWTLVGDNVSLVGPGVISRQGSTWELSGDRSVSIFANGPITQAELWMPGQKGNLFNEDHIAILAGEIAVIRTGPDWSETNLWFRNGSSKDAFHTWGERPLRHHSRWNIVPWEVHALYANELDCDLWINIPHLTDDVYVRSLARLLKNTLEPGRKLIVEYSNEIWNEGFPQGRDAKAIAMDGALPGKRGKPGSVAGSWARPKFEIFKREYGTGVKFAVMGHVTTPDFAKDMLEVVGFADIVGCSGYLPPDSSEFDALPREEQLMITPTQFVEACIKNIPRVERGLKAHRDLARRYRASFELYEWAPSDARAGYKPWGLAWIQAFDSPEFAALHQMQYDLFDAVGVRRACYYAFSQLPAHGSGTWGLWYDLYNPTFGAEVFLSNPPDKK